MSNEIVRTEAKPSMSIVEQMEFSKIVSSGDMLPKEYRDKPANALIAINIGNAMGLSPAESLYRIDVINGKPSASAELIAQNVRKAGHKLRVISDPVTMTATAQIIRKDDPDFVWERTRDMDWARSMGLANKDQWKKQPLTMLEWRAISAVARVACSEALYGVAYETGELEDMGEQRNSGREQRTPRPVDTPAPPAAAEPGTPPPAPPAQEAAPPAPPTPNDAPTPPPPPPAPNQSDPVDAETVEMISADQWNQFIAAAQNAGLSQPQAAALVQRTIGRNIPGPEAIYAEEFDSIMQAIGDNKIG